MASYMTMTLKHRHAAKSGLLKPCWMAMAVVMPCAGGAARACPGVYFVTQIYSAAMEARVVGGPPKACS